MSDHYETGTVVLVIAEGEHEGKLAYIAEWAAPTGKYVVDVSGDGEFVDFEPSDLAVLIPASRLHNNPEGDNQDPDSFDQIPPFGMTRDQTADYVADFIDVCMARSINDGPSDTEENFQEFETDDFKNLLLSSLTQLEAATVGVAQAHLRVRRVLEAIGDSL